MKKFVKLFVYALTVFAFSFSMASGEEIQKPDSAEMAKMMEEYMKLSQPSEEHKVLEKLAGEWNIEVKIWNSPGSEPMIFNGTCSNKMILGGRFLQTESESGTGAMKTNTFSIMGYDRRHKKYTTIGFDTWGTYYVTASGTMDKETNTITMYGEDEDPIMGFTQKYNMIGRFKSDDNYSFEVVFLDPVTLQGTGSFKMVEIDYKRIK